jgi:hypothetical protein
VDNPFAPLRGWFPVEVFHFPLRSAEQCAHKAELQGHAFETYVRRAPTAYHAAMFEALRGGTIRDYYEGQIVEDDELARGQEEGRLVVDTRLRDALRSVRDEAGSYALPRDTEPLEFPLPTLVEDAEYAVEAAVLGEADVVRLQRRLDTLENRLLSLELRLPTRVYRKVSRTAKRALRRDGS